LRLANLPVGQDAQLTVKRGADIVNLTVRPVTLEGYLGEEKGFTQWGVSVREVTRRYAVANQLDKVAGVWITSQSDGEPFERAHLQQGQVILAVNNQPVTDMASFEKLYKESVDRKDETVFLQVQESHNTFNSILEVKKYAPGNESADN
jgi:serine protease Do